MALEQSGAGFAEREPVRRLVLERVDELGELMLQAILAEIPAYRALDPRQLAEVKAIATWLLRRLIDLWVSGSELAPEDLARVRGIGAARAVDGRPLPSVLRAYRVASNLAIGLIGEQAEALLSVPGTVAFARLWLTSFDQLTEAIYEGYSHSAERLHTDRSRALRDFLDDLLAGRQAHAGAAGDRSRALGITLPNPALLLVAEPVSEPQDLAAELCPDVDVLVTARGRRAIVLMPVHEHERIRAALAAAGARGCAVRPPRPESLVDAYRLALLALDLAPPDAYEAGPLLRESDAYALALLAGRPPGGPMVVARQLLGALLDPGQEHVREGLEAFLAAGSATTAAARVGLHPQSLRYRLRRVRELTDRDTRRSWDRFVLDLGSRLASLSEERHG